MSVLKVKQREWMTGEVRKLRAMWELGFTASQIGAAMGRSRHSICSAARRYDLPARPCPIGSHAKPDLVRQRQEELGRIAAFEELLRAA